MNITKHTDETGAREYILNNKNKVVALESLISCHINDKEYADAQTEIVKAIHISVHIEILLHTIFTNNIKNKLYNIADLELLISIQKQTKNLKEHLFTTKEYINPEMSNIYIETALIALQNADYSGYFEEMDKVVPAALQTPYQEHKGKFMAGNYPYNFYQQLEVFAREVDKALNQPTSNVINNNGNGNINVQGVDNNSNVTITVNPGLSQPKQDISHTSKTTILMLTANPAGTTKLNLDKEHSKIAEKLQSHHNKFSLIVKKAINKNEFKEYTEEVKPTILHFSGHGEKVTEDLRDLGIAETEEGIILQNEDKNGYDSLSSEMIDVLFEYFKDEKINLQLVVLNACYSETQAQVIAKYVPYVIGTTKAIADTCAIAFSTGLYFKLSTEVEIEQAFKSGRTAAVLEKANKADFVLFKNGQKLDI